MIDAYLYLVKSRFYILAVGYQESASINISEVLTYLYQPHHISHLEFAENINVTLGVSSKNSSYRYFVTI